MDSRADVYSSSFSAWINLICMLSENIILKELSKIIDPDFNRDIVSLDLLRIYQLTVVMYHFQLS